MAAWPHGRKFCIDNVRIFFTRNFTFCFAFSNHRLNLDFR